MPLPKKLPHNKLSRTLKGSSDGQKAHTVFQRLRARGYMVVKMSDEGPRVEVPLTKTVFRRIVKFGRDRIHEREGGVDNPNPRHVSQLEAAIHMGYPL